MPSKTIAVLLGSALFSALMPLHAQLKNDSAAPASPAQLATAIFAGGCFWTTEADFEKVQGVINVVTGYTGGRVPNPSYEQVSSGSTGHAEAVRVSYDASKVSYAQLVDYFWRNIDPTVKDRQFCDIGNQYRTGIYFLNDAQRQDVEASLKSLQESGRFKKIYTEIAPAGAFYVAEEFHQDFHKKHPEKYMTYRANCGRHMRLLKLWGQK